MDPNSHEGIYSERPLKVICVGAGASGILLAYKLRKHLSQVSLTIYEKNSDISGTWHENTYPGCACDVPAHNYTYSFEPKHDWSSVYASSSEIKGYFKSFCSKYGLGANIKTSHTVENATWVESTGEWDIEVADVRTGNLIKDKCHVLIYGGGYLNNWAWPDVPGRLDFKGAMLHSANWDDSVEIEGKTIALLGSGSSAVQILPKIQPLAQNISTFVRSPIWILPTISSKPKAYTQVEKSEFLQDAAKLTTLRKHNENIMNSIYSLYLAGSNLQTITKQQLEDSMRHTINNKELEDALVPEWGVGCRRLTPDTGYLESIKQDNVKVIKSGVSSFLPDGCIDDLGQKHIVDVIICATGFNMSFVPRFPILGKDGRNLQDVWASEPSSYLGIGVCGFPNFLMFLGPFSPVANGPTLASIEAQADHIIKLLDRYQTELIHSFQPSSSAQSDFTAHVKQFMQKTVYTDVCRSGHKNHTVSARVPTLWPGSTLHYLQTMEDVRGEDWDIRYNGNRFSFLGNGISHAEFDPTSDLAYYVRESDDGRPLTRRGRMKVTMRSGSQPQRQLHTTNRPSVINLEPRDSYNHLKSQSEKVDAMELSQTGFRRVRIWLDTMRSKVWQSAICAKDP